MVHFEGYERRIDKITAELNKYGIKDLEEAKAIVDGIGVNVDAIVRGIQPICFDNAVWAYTVGAAIAVKLNVKLAAEAAEALGLGLQSFVKKPNASLSLPVTKALLQPKVLSALPRRLTRSGQSPFALSSTVSARMRHTSYRVLTASLTLRPSTMNTPMSSTSSMRKLSPMVRRARFAATAPTMSTRALQS